MKSLGLYRPAFKGKTCVKKFCLHKTQRFLCININGSLQKCIKANYCE